MKTTQTYKGYVGSVEFSEEDLVYFGKVLFIDDMISYESESEDGIQKSFERAIDEYLIDCKAIGHEPNKSADQPIGL